jgi:hypothetical protein
MHKLTKNMKQQSRPPFAWLLLTKDEKMWYRFFYDMAHDIYYNTNTIGGSKYYFFKKNMKKFGRYKINN